MRHSNPQLAAWHRLPSMTGRAWRYLIEHGDEDPSQWSASRWQESGIDASRAATLTQEMLAVDTSNSAEMLEKFSINMVAIADDDYPAQLKEIYSPPSALYVRGSLAALRHPCLAVVGTRQPTSYGLAATRQLIEPVAQHGLTIISGLALGVDTAAHQAALAVGGSTVAILGHGLDTIYPWQNQALAEAIIASGGAIISEFPLGSRPERHHFPQRNRIISGLSQAILLIEAGFKSGALITAKFAVEQNREVLILPGNISSPQSVGPLNWLKLGATAVTSSDDILAVFSMSTNSVTKPKIITLPTDPIEAAIVQELAVESRHIDWLSGKCRLDTSVVSAALSLLELRGLVRHDGGMIYSLTP